MSEEKHSKILRLILGDQLNSQHSWFKQVDPNVTFVMMELRSETNYATHHIQKIIGFFAAMRQFAEQLRTDGHKVIYLKLDDPANMQSFTGNIWRLIEMSDYKFFEYQLPDEYRVDEEMKSLSTSLPVQVNTIDTEHFFSERSALKDFFHGKKTFLMETFYRKMRIKHGILMDREKPLTGQWNYDQENRKKLPKGHIVVSPLLFENDVTEIYELIERSGIKTMGSCNAQRFLWPVDRFQSLQLLEYFISKCLPLFGNYEDAMTVNSWSLYHSRLSFAMNIKMLSPQEVVQAAILEWDKRQDEISFNQLEGFVRQIHGWREFMRGVYWAKMPEFASMNFFEHDRKLPEWYWTGKTNMNCLKHAITQSLDFAYAHHIQRLMITGNFALLAGVHPDEVDEWYLGIYIDALDWVEITNTRGMSQFADGGIIGSKPYVSSAAYIDKMSDYCRGCYYDKTKKYGEKSCPFNSLYWNFHNSHAEKLAKNPRISMTYKVWERMKQSDKTALLEQAEKYLMNINEL